MRGSSAEPLRKTVVMNSRPVQNRLLQALPAEALEALRPSLEHVELKKRQILHHSGTPMEYVYFIEEGLVSVSAKASSDKWIEVWLIGSEGMTGLPVLLGDKDSPPLRRTVQVGGQAYRVSRADFESALDQCQPLYGILLRYAEFVLLQASQAHVCDAQHSLKQRLGRWLLLARDALEREEIPLTHQTLARLLGVRRASVTECLKVLEDEAVLHHSRGLVRITSPDQLQTLSCACYGLIRSEYRRLVR